MDKVSDFSLNLSELSLAQLLSLRDLARADCFRIQAEYHECLNHERKISEMISAKGGSNGKTTVPDLRPTFVFPTVK